VDDGYEQGQDIPIFYDPMIAKLVVHAATRDEAIDRLCRAIDEYKLQGFANTLGFGKWAVQHEAFRSGNFDTKFIERYFKPEYLVEETADAAEVAALLSSIVWTKHAKAKAQPMLTETNGTISGWKMRRK
jgi:acetyl/propionyl-CoA carboxylase alpha subunit